MAITFDPIPGLVLMCDFGTCFTEPEMVKNRPVVVITRKLRGRANLCTVVPLSTSEPHAVSPWHHNMDTASIPARFNTGDNWAKCDMLTTVAYHRLNRIVLSKNGPNGNRVYSQLCVTKKDLEAIRKCIISTLSLGNLISE